MWKRGRSRFLRRVGCLFAVLLFLSAIGAASLLSLAVRGHVGILAAAAAVIILLAIFFAGMRRLGFPLGDIVAAADRVAGGDFSTRVAERGPPSLRSVARAFNSMTGRLQAQDQQRRNLMADIAHELRTPLTVIQGRLEGLLDGVYPRDDGRLNEVLDDTRVLARLVEDLRTLANSESGVLTLQKEPSDLAMLIHDAASSLSAAAGRHGVTLRVENSTELPLVEIDPVRIREVVTNLLSNAIDHTGDGGVVAIAAQQIDGGIAVKVSDTGSGISQEDLPRIFDRFFKGLESHGSGLGLTIARNLLVAHGGEIRAESRVGQGTTITFTLPLEAKNE